MTTCSVTSTPARFARCLANFQVDELLLLKKSVQRMQLEEDDPIPATECPTREPLKPKVTDQMPEHLPLMAADRVGYDSSGGSSAGPWHSSDPPSHHPTGPWAEPKPTKLQTLFQISITALAFLSFGGYLLCLIVQAIKSKGTTYFHPVATAATGSSNGNTKRIKVYRRSRRSNSQMKPPPMGSLFQQDYASYMRSVRGRMLT